MDLTKPTIELINPKLEEINPEITKSDRDACMVELKLSKQTLSSYMNGKGTNLQTADEILAFMRNRIAERLKRIGLNSLLPNA